VALTLLGLSRWTWNVGLETAVAIVRYNFTGRPADDLEQLLMATRTVSHLVVRDDEVVYERCLACPISGSP
jgi:hypothetical protein